MAPSRVRPGCDLSYGRIADRQEGPISELDLEHRTEFLEEESLGSGWVAIEALPEVGGGGGLMTAALAGERPAELCAVDTAPIVALRISEIPAVPLQQAAPRE